MSIIKGQVNSLASRALECCSKEGESNVIKFQGASQLLLEWLSYLNKNAITGTSNSLLIGLESSTREAAACIALGLVRPALSSIRLQIDLGLSWLFFKDHPVEWERVQDTGEGYKLKQELLKYLSESYPKFGKRFNLLKEFKVRSLADPYRLLSAHIHGQSESTLPAVSDLSDVVLINKCQDAVALQRESVEYLSDVFLAIYIEQWAGLPEKIMAELNSRVKIEKKRAELFN